MDKFTRDRLIAITQQLGEVQTEIMALRDEINEVRDWFDDQTLKTLPTGTADLSYATTDTRLSCARGLIFTAADNLRKAASLIETVTGKEKMQDV